MSASFGSRAASPWMRRRAIREYKKSIGRPEKTGRPFCIRAWGENEHAVRQTFLQN
ncbi:MAG TPA: hypothetical protein VJB99_00190 [Patescibacteria group bacterium]|nr:hypothetical protein [Patescibacteria group bacterium]